MGDAKNVGLRNELVGDAKKLGLRNQLVGNANKLGLRDRAQWRVLKCCCSHITRVIKSVVT